MRRPAIIKLLEACRNRRMPMAWNYDMDEHPHFEIGQSGCIVNGIVATAGNT